jgi:hypothetical protein
MTFKPAGERYRYECECGSKMRKGQHRCDKCQVEGNILTAVEYVLVETSGKCPLCGQPLVYNNALCTSDWLQCRGYGMHNWKDNAGKVLHGPSCGFQILANRDDVAKVKHHLYEVDENREQRRKVAAEAERNEDRSRSELADSKIGPG